MGQHDGTSSDESPSVRALLDRTQITDLIYRYSRAVDRLDADLLRSVYWPDGTDDHGLFDGNAMDYVDWVIGYVGTWISTHHDNTNVLLELEGDVAWGECHWTGWYRMVEGGVVVDRVANGRYLDRFERRNGEWRIAHRTCVSDWNRAAVRPDGDERDHRLKGRRGPDDLVHRLRELGLQPAGAPAVATGPQLGTPFHCGMVVRDLDTAMAQMGAALGCSWAKVQTARYTYATVDELVPTTHRYTYSIGAAPHVELIEGEAGSIWEPATDVDLHHLGYWADDLPTLSAALTAAGSPMVATMGPEFGRPKVFSYHRPPGAGVWIELVDVSLRAVFAPWLAGGDMLPRPPRD